MLRLPRLGLFGDFAILAGLAAGGYFLAGIWGVAAGLAIFAVLLMFAGGEESHDGE